MSEKIILGIDPGLKNFAYVFLKGKVSEYLILKCGILDLTIESERPEQLKYLFYELSSLIEKYDPDVMVTEKIIYKHFRSSFILTQVYSILLLLSSIKNKKLYEYTPLEIKKSIVGQGKASKISVKNTLKLLIPFLENELKKQTSYINYDLYDAIAVSIAHIKKNHFLNCLKKREIR